MYPFAPCKGIWIPILGDPGADIGDEGKSKRAEKCGTYTYTFFHPFRLSLAPFICPWVSEEGRGGGGRRSCGGDLTGLSWPWGRALDRSCSPGRGNFESFFAWRGTDVGIFDCWLGRKRLKPNSHASRMRRTVWKVSCIDQLNLSRYCGI